MLCSWSWQSPYLACTCSELGLDALSKAKGASRAMWTKKYASLSTDRVSLAPRSSSLTCSQSEAESSQTSCRETPSSCWTLWHSSCCQWILELVSDSLPFSSTLLSDFSMASEAWCSWLGLDCPYLPLSLGGSRSSAPLFVSDVETELRLNLSLLVSDREVLQSMLSFLALLEHVCFLMYGVCLLRCCCQSWRSDR